MKYYKYDNYNAINIDKVKDIPIDYPGAMGVPITFLDKYNPEQFELLGTSDNGLVDDKYKKIGGNKMKELFSDPSFKNIIRDMYDGENHIKEEVDGFQKLIIEGLYRKYVIEDDFKMVMENYLNFHYCNKFINKKIREQIDLFYSTEQDRSYYEGTIKGGPKYIYGAEYCSESYFKNLNEFLLHNFEFYFSVIRLKKDQEEVKKKDEKKSRWFLRK